MKEALTRHVASNSGALTYGEIKSFLTELRREQEGSADDVTEAEVSCRAYAVFPPSMTASYISVDERPSA